ncbi:vanz-like protein [Sporothrix brasiliensis 5110]|uniref:Vanz-like protein n=1 Tax=Sporothrix brasiliensis 5110 TaxID=1398154 RepID=A0A0C2ERV6_9PEZI|nr:vanz-like protein [Sporothrix brasiliensis 5110]KIH89084.1 vanz-like protein [Sporothrix brasiliensis 5110]
MYVAGIFFLLLLLAGYAGLSSLQLGDIVNDKILHFVTFFLLTVAFYWIVDTSRRRTMNMALAVCTGGLGVGSEVLQALLPDNGRVFDAMDIVANVLGSLAALGLCSWYHKRMLDRKRNRKYAAVPGEEGHGDEVLADTSVVDIELGEGVGDQSTILHDGGNGEVVGTFPPAKPLTSPADVPTKSTAAGAATSSTAVRGTTLEEELDNWDENAEDNWDADDTGDIGEGSGTAKKRTD